MDSSFLTDRLDELYSDARTGFGSAEDLFRRAQEAGINASRGQVRGFVDDREETELFREKRRRTNFNKRSKLEKQMNISRKPAKRSVAQITSRVKKGEKYERKKESGRFPIASTVSNDLWELDLMDFSKEDVSINKGFKFAMMVIDSFTRELSSDLMKTKSSEEALMSFKKIVSKRGKPRALLADTESGFTSATFLNYLDSIGVELVLVKSAGTVERAIRTIRNWMEKAMHSKGRRWIDLVGKFVEKFNNTKNRVLELTPKEVVKAEEGSGKAGDDFDAIVRQQEDIEQKTEIAEKSVGREAKKFKVGDMVRIELGAGAFKKGAGQKRTAETFPVVSVGKSFVVVKQKGVDRKFNPNDLTKSRVKVSGSEKPDMLQKKPRTGVAANPRVLGRGRPRNI
jgi:hypothetical protein